MTQHDILSTTSRTSGGAVTEETSSGGIQQHHQQQQPSSWLLRLRPAHLEERYWMWRAAQGLHKVDLAYALYTATWALITLLAGDGDGAADRRRLSAVAPWLVALVAFAAAQAAIITLAPASYQRRRAPLVLAARVLGAVVSARAARALAAPRLAARLASAPRAVPVLKAASLATGALRQALAPFFAPLPWRLALLPQLLDVHLAASAGGALAAAALETRPELGDALALARDSLDGSLHVASGLLLPGAHAPPPASCARDEPAALVRFAHLLVGAALPLYIVYHAQRADLTRFVSAVAGTSSSSSSPLGGGGGAGAGDGPAGERRRSRVGGGAGNGGGAGCSGSGVQPSSSAAKKAAPARAPSPSAPADAALLLLHGGLGDDHHHQHHGGVLEAACAHAVRVTLLVLATWAFASHAWRP